MNPHWGGIGHTVGRRMICPIISLMLVGPELTLRECSWPLLSRWLAGSTVPQECCHILSIIHQKGFYVLDRASIANRTAIMYHQHTLKCDTGHRMCCHLSTVDMRVSNVPTPHAVMVETFNSSFSPHCNGHK